MLRTLFLTLTLFISFAHADYSEAVKLKKIYPLGEKIYNKRCPDIATTDIQTEDALHDAIEQSSCAKLSKKHKEALFLYLWDVKLHQKKHTLKDLSVTKEQKCPVCGMFLYKYPRWVSMIEYNNGKKYYFDGMKDLMKYYFDHQEGVTEIWSRAYYTQKPLNVEDAYFVIGSDVYGPMGHELIPISTKDAANKFLIEHRGKKILRFDAITPEVINELD